MSFVTCNCPTCGQRIVLNNMVERGFCLYCGTEVPTSDLEGTEELDRIMRVILYSGVDDLEDLPWYDDMRPAFDLLEELRFEEAVAEFEKGCEGVSLETLTDMDMTFLDMVVSSIVKAVLSGEEPDPELDAVYDMFERHGTILAHEQAGVIVQTLINFSWEAPEFSEELSRIAYIVAARSFRRIPTLAHQGLILETLIDALDQSEEEAVRSMMYAALIVDDAMLTGVDDIESDELQDLMDYWSDNWDGEVGALAERALMLVFEGGEMGIVVGDAADEYVEAYLAPLYEDEDEEGARKTYTRLGMDGQ